MSNLIEINIAGEDKVILEDGYGAETIISDYIPSDDFELLTMVIQETRPGCDGEDMIDSLTRCEKGIKIRGTWYDYEEIQETLDEAVSKKPV